MRYIQRMMYLMKNAGVMGRSVAVGALGFLCSSGNAQVCDLEELFDRHVQYGVGDEPIAIRVADFDGDRIRDLAVLNRRGGDLSILLGVGEGQFAPESRYPVGNYPREFEVGDMDLDGDLDLVVSMGSETDFKVMLNDGHGGFDVLHSYSLGYYQKEVALYDFDADGLLDIALATNEGVRVLINDATDPFMSGFELLTELSVAEVELGDIDVDGNIDVLARIWQHNDGCDFRVVRGLGGLTFAEPTCEPTTSGGNTHSLLLDLDEDSDLDLVFTKFSDDGVCTMKHRELGDFVNEYHIPPSVSRPSGITHADFNLDGYPDLAMSRYSGISATVFLGLSRGFFQTGGVYSVGWDSRSIDSGDLDRDGDIDLIVGNDDSDTISVLINLCDTVVCFADFSPDGQLDFFDVSIFLASYLAGSSIADFNHDGDLNFFDVTAFIAAFNAGCP